jgi:hypothetical protein
MENRNAEDAVKEEEGAFLSLPLRPPRSLRFYFFLRFLITFAHNFQGKTGKTGFENLT